MNKAILKKFSYLPVGFAIFSMFFGAGNSIFPLLIGTYAASQNLFAVLGMVISAILVPLLGLFGIALYEGDYKSFFYRLGSVPGFLIISMIMVLIGPFAGIPRCITLAYSTLKPHLGGAPLALFSGVACLVIFVKTIKKTKLIDILGKFLTPVLLSCLALIIIKGIYTAPEAASPALPLSNAKVFSFGLIKGFQMMDLLASFFFSATVIACVKARKGETKTSSVKTFLKGAVLSGFLLMVVYVGFSYVTAKNSLYFRQFSGDSLLSAVGLKILGTHLGFVMGLAVALACLTTAITLVSVFSEFLHKECLSEKVPYSLCIVLTVITAFCFSNLGFVGICNMIEPTLFVCYPALITLTIVNIFHKMYDFKPVKWPVYAVLLLSVMLNIFHI